MKSIAEAGRAWLVMYGLAFRAYPFGAVVRPLLTLVSFVATGVIPAIALQQTIVAAGSNDGSRALAWILVLGVAALSRGLIAAVWRYIQTRLMWCTEQATRQAMMHASLRCAGIEHLESPQYADNMAIAQQYAGRAGILVDWLATGMAEIVSLAVAAVVLSRLQPLLLAPVAVVVLAGAAGVSSRNRALTFYSQSIPGQRLRRRLTELGTSRAAAEEVRLLNLAPWLIERHRSVAADVVRRMIGSERRPLAMAAGAAVVQALMLAAGIVILTLGLGTRTGSVANLALGIVLLQSTMTQAMMLGYMGADLSTNTFAARRFVWLLRYRPAVSIASKPVPVPASLERGIVFDDVSFTYPGGDRTALDGVSLALRPGSTVAFVGDNGAGKSTLVKLLCRLYDPSAGRITVDGTDLRDLDLAAWRAASTGCFQDFIRFYLIARESVGIGDLRAVGDLGRVRSAARLRGADSLLRGLRDGYETQLGPQFTGGTQLSTGEWQKVALSRGVMRTAPLLLMLDEPTASLDAAAEHALFQQYAEEASAARGRGAITVLVSHRFSTVATADHIVVLDNGRIAEEGSHDQLMEKGGRYAYLFRTQAAAYA